MAVPNVEESGDGGPKLASQPDEAESADDGPEMASEPDDAAPDEPDVEEVELQEDDFADDAASDLFSGTESASSDDSDDEDSDDEDDAADGLEELTGAGAQLEEAINDGAAELATVQLPEDEDRDELRDEFRGVFEAFRLGHFGGKFVEEYVLVSGDDEIDPAYGLLGAMLCCAGFVLWMRPDGDQKVQSMKDAAANIAGGAA